ncbi:MAG: flagellin [Pirellulaceae bacterium]
MSRINTNVSSLIAQTNLNRSNTQLQTALSRLSTGLRINSGEDDPAGLIASENLRRDITAANKAISNSERANQLIATADSALAQISGLLNDIRGLTTEAANSGALSTEQIAANQLQVDASLDAIDRIAAVTTFQGRKILDGSLDFTTSGSNPSITNLQINSASLGTAGVVPVAVDITSAATQASLNVAALRSKGAFTLGGQTFTLTAAVAGEAFNNVRVDVTSSAGATNVTYAAGVLTLDLDIANAAITAAQITAAFAANGTFTATSAGAGTINGVTTPPLTTGVTTANTVQDITFQLSGVDGAQVFSFRSGATAAQIASAINLVSDSTGVSAVAAAGALTFTSTGYGADSKVRAEIISENALGTFAANLSGTAASGVDIAATINGFTASGKGNTISLNNSALNLDVTVAAGSTTDLAFNITGGGALFQIGPNVNSGGQSRIGVKAVNTGKLGGFSGRLYELKSGNAKDLDSDPSSAAKVVDQAISSVTGQRGRFGAFQHATLDTNVASLKDTIANLSEAESSIRDADFAKESAALTRAQILVQSGTAVLQIANQNPQQVLALLRG